MTSVPGRYAPYRGKRQLDVLIASVAALLTLPLAALAGGLVWLESGSPVLYRATRVGEGGRLIVITKLRSMSTAGSVGVTYNADPRVTRFGRVLRRFKIDELPQLWNVLRGEMSIVGPRPEDPRYVDWSDPVHRHVFTAKPGITGPAQLRFRHEERLLTGPDPERIYRQVVLPAKVQLDLEYLQHQSLLLDLRIMLETARALVAH